MNAIPEIERRRAAGLAGHTGDVDGARAALSDPAAAVRAAGLRSLDRLDAIGPADLQRGLDDPEPSVRIAALELAASRREPPLDRLLDDPDPMVVECAAWAAGERPDPTPDRIDRLTSLAAGHDDPLVREAAVAALGALGDTRGLGAVLAATRDKPAVRRRAVVALAAFEGPEVEEAWRRARGDRDRQVREAVEELLGPAEEPAG